MFDHTPQRPPYRSRPHTCSVTGSLLLVAGVIATIWAISHPLPTVVVAVAAAVVVLSVRTLRARVALSTTAPPTVAAGRIDGP